MSGAITPITAELDSVARSIPGMGFSHVYGAFNMAYGVGSACKISLKRALRCLTPFFFLVGPLIGGQFYDHVRNGWPAVMGFVAGMSLVASVLCFFFIDEAPVAKRLLKRKGKAGTESHTTTQN